MEEEVPREVVVVAEAVEQPAEAVEQPAEAQLLAVAELQVV